MKLVEILTEDLSKKALIMAGGGGAGKSWLVDKLPTKDLPLINPDTYVERDGIPLAAASSMVDKEVEKLSDEGEPFIWDTTASKTDKVEALLEKDYDVLMVMVYTHPFISFISNFKRERKLPKSAVFSTWSRVYELLEDYRQMLDHNFLLYVNMRGGKYDEEVEKFNQAAQKGGDALFQFLDETVNRNPEKYKSTFSKPFDIEDSKASEEYEKEVSSLDFDRDDESVNKQLKRHFMKKWKKDGVGPGEKSMKTKLKAIYRNRDRSAERYREDINKVAETVTSSEFQSLLKSDSLPEIKTKVKKFLQ